MNGRKEGLIGSGNVGSSFSLALTINNPYLKGSDLELYTSNHDTIFIATKDKDLVSVAKKISFFDVKDKWFIHFSGSYSSECFNVLKEKGAKIASFHPLQTFPEKNLKERFNNIVFAAEGDSEILLYLENVASSFNSKMIKIKTQDKIKYHMAACISCNLLTSLLSISESLLKEADIEGGLLIHQKLIETTISGIMEKGVVDSLSGPVERGDNDTVLSHLEIETSEMNKKVYAMLSKVALELALKKKSITKEDYIKIKKTLSDFT